MATAAFAFNFIALGPFMVIAICDAISFQPHANEIAQIIAQASPDDAAPPAIMKDMILSSHGHLSYHAVRLVRAKLGLKAGRHLEWHITGLLWTLLSNVHYTDTDILTILNSLVYTGQAYGLNATSLMRFGKPLHDVTEQVAAELAVLVLVPSLQSNPIRFEQVRDHFLARYHQYVAGR